MKQWAINNKGFTIVELLIVIVVIAILATITITAYNGISNRAFNSSIISSAKQAKKLLMAYKSVNSDYPGLGGYCLTRDNNCTNYAGTKVTSDNSALLNKLNTIGTPVTSVAPTTTAWYGLYIDGYSPRTYNHAGKPYLVMYWLKGSQQNCGIEDTVVGDPAPLPGETNSFLTSTTGYTSTASDRTSCWISLP